MDSRQRGLLLPNAAAFINADLERIRNLIVPEQNTVPPALETGKNSQNGELSRSETVPQANFPPRTKGRRRILFWIAGIAVVFAGFLF